ncbi:MAG: amino acid permease [Sediminibacterium sp.]|nr:amino acid permease [Sediminibacterium sp.]
MKELKRTLGFTTTIAIVVGGIIGSGIFMKPAFMAAQLGSPLLLLSVWVVAGLMTMCGALCNAEVAAMMPVTGGQLIFFKKMYGDKFAFLYGWASFSVFNTAGNASIAYICATYSNYFFHLPNFNIQLVQHYFFHIPFIGDIYPLDNFGIKSLTILYIVIFTIINYCSVQMGGFLQKLVTLLQTSAIIFLIVGITFSGKGNIHHFTQVYNLPKGTLNLLSAYMACISAAFWAYDGWNNITFIAGEIKNPQKNIPRSLFVGLLIIMGIYLALNACFMYILPIDKIAASTFLASDTAVIAIGGYASILVTLMIIFANAGSSNACILSTARITYTLGKENTFFKWAGKEQPRFHTPGNALILNGIWSSLLVISGSFDILTDMLVFVTWFFYGMSGIGLFVLRKKMKDTIRVYTVWGYPIVPIIFILFVFIFLIVTLYGDINDYLNHTTNLINSVFGIAITLVGFPIYYLSKKMKGNTILPIKN